MSSLAFDDVDYCKYGLSYRNRTRLWNNIETWEPRPLCRKECGPMTEDGRRHVETAQRLPGGRREAWGENYRVTPVPYRHLRAVETVLEIVCRRLIEIKILIPMRLRRNTYADKRTKTEIQLIVI